MATGQHLEFERDILDLERQIQKLLDTAQRRDLDVTEELALMRSKLLQMRQDTFRNLTPMEQVQVARHPRRPYTLDFIQRIADDWVELHGDRLYRDDEAVVTGWASFGGRSVMVVGHQKGRDIKENLRRNFGMPHPEGYRKALRAMRQAEKFSRPVVTFIDTLGAYPGMGSEERGIAESIALNLREMARLRVPILAVVIGEGMSGGALGIGLCDRLLMLEHAIYSVISPEGCAAILWRSAQHKEQAAEALRLTSTDLLRLGVVDEVVPEPPGGAHSDWDKAAALLAEAVERNLEQLGDADPEALFHSRLDRYERIGQWRGA